MGVTGRGEHAVARCATDEKEKCKFLLIFFFFLNVDGNESLLSDTSSHKPEAMSKTFGNPIDKASQNLVAPLKRLRRFA